MDNDTMVAVTPKDREAAWPLRPTASTGAEPIDRFGWFRGDYDDDSAIQAFARHRRQSETGAALPSDGREDAFEAGWQEAREHFQVARGIPGSDALKRRSADYLAALAQPVEAGEDGLAERAAIVAWLRGEVDTGYTDPEFDIGRNLAEAINQGRHIVREDTPG